MKEFVGKAILILALWTPIDVWFIVTHKDMNGAFLLLFTIFTGVILFGKNKSK